jgi:SAM-dependent methyltransferase
VRGTAPRTLPRIASFMQAEAFRVLRDFEERHWWFRARRVLIREQVRKATAELGDRSRKPRILDFGCGTGFNLKLLNEFGSVTGADQFRPEQEEFRLSHGFPLLDVERDLDAHAGGFELVTALDVLEHLDDDAAGLRSLSRLLAPGGQLLLTVPAYPWLWGRDDVANGHRRRYTQKSLTRAIDAAGLRVRFISHFNLLILPIMTPVIWAQRLRRLEPGSGLWIPSPWLNEALYEATAREAKLVGTERIAPAAGASIVCRLQRRDD